MNGLELSGLITGASLMGYVVAGVFFLRFWKDTGDRFFAIFSASFLLLGLQRLLVALTPQIPRSCSEPGFAIIPPLGQAGHTRYKPV